MKQQTNKKETPDEESTSTADEPPAMSFERALLSVAGPYDRTNTGLHGNATRATTENRPAEKQGTVFSCTALVRSAPPFEDAVLAGMPGAYRIPGPPVTFGADYVDPLHVVVEEEEERRSVSTAGSVDAIEHELQQQNIVSAYRVHEEEPIIATPFKDNRFPIFISGVFVTAAVIALIVGLSVGLTAKSKEVQRNDSPGRLVSSINVTADQVGEFVKANRYSRTENGREIVTTTGSAVLNYCEVVPCIQGGCEWNGRKVYEPGCCLGNNCSASDKCGGYCPRSPDLCRPSFDGCRDASCFECKLGPNGEVLYRYRDASYNINCLRTGVATGLNDKDDDVVRIYKWAIACGFNVQGGNEWENAAPGEYVCGAFRIGDGITKTVSQVAPCQLIQLAECGCGPDDMNTFGLPPPDKSCKTKQDCPFLCDDAGEEAAKTLCEAFPGVEWWEGENPLYQPLFYEPEGFLFGNVTIEIDIYGEG